MTEQNKSNSEYFTCFCYDMNSDFRFITELSWIRTYSLNSRSSDVKSKDKLTLHKTFLFKKG